jgi:hypothetical protein
MNERMMKKCVFIFLTFLTVVTASAQEHKFSPEKFQADMEAFLAHEANLTQQEAARLFPIFREMHQKQRAVYGRMRKLSQEKPADEAACAKVISECDKMNIELKQIEQQYHKKMLQEVSAFKVSAVIMAESRFHRDMMKGWQRGGRGRRP